MGTGNFAMLEKLKDWKKTHVFKTEMPANARAIWSVIGLMTVADAIGLKVQGMSLVLHALIANVAAISIIMGISFIYSCVRRSPRIAEMTHMMAILLAYTCSGAIASYIAATVHRPLFDAQLAAADRALGLNWIACYRWVAAHPHIEALFLTAYASLIPQLLFVIMMLNFKGFCARGWEVIWLFVVSCTGCLILSAIWPAAGAFGYYHIEANRPYVQVFLGLHNGAIKIIGNQPIQGIIQFPSFHVALAILLTYAARGFPILFITFLEINILLFLSTPAIGGHHFADLWGGVALALASIWLVRKVVSPRLGLDMTKVMEM